MKRAIVLFATKYGGTQEIAEKLAMELDIPHRNVNHINDRSELDLFDTLILGAPIYGNDISEDMRHFLNAFFVPINEKRLITFVVYGITKGNIEIDYRPVMTSYLSTKPVLTFSFIGRLTKTALDEKDYHWMQQFYRNRLGTELMDFDYFDPRKIEAAAEKIALLSKRNG